MKAGLIISTYNWKEALNVTLESVKLQSFAPHEVVVCDDGSLPDVRAVVKFHQKDFPCPLKFVWQPDEGFRVASSRNNAIRELSSDTDYVVIIDEDMALHNRFIEDHMHFSEPDCFTQGSRALISKKKTAEIIEQGKMPSSFGLINKGVAKRKNTFHSHFISRVLSKPNKALKGVRACNMGFWKDDLYAVNGFNEQFVGWGREDTELAVRLFNKGIMRKNIKFSAIAFHLYHSEQSRLGISDNDYLLSQAINSKLSWCKSGLL